MVHVHCGTDYVREYRALYRRALCGHTHSASDTGNVYCDPKNDSYMYVQSEDNENMPDESSEKQGRFSM